MTSGENNILEGLEYLGRTYLVTQDEFPNLSLESYQPNPEVVTGFTPFAGLLYALTNCFVILLFIISFMIKTSTF
jgi:hypothetical protein